MTVKTINNVMVIEANFSMEELSKVHRHKPDVLSLKDDNGDMFFAVKPSKHVQRIATIFQTGRYYPPVWFIHIYFNVIKTVYLNLDALRAIHMCI